MNALTRLQIREIATLKRELEREVLRREKAEKALKATKQHYAKLLATSDLAKAAKVHLARQVLLEQEAERSRISRSLHDEVSQTLAGINVVLASLSKEPSVNAASFKRKVSKTQHLVENSLKIIHKFARDLRPTLLDDIGLIPALHAFMKALTQRTGLQIRFTAFAGVEKLSNAKRTALFRVAQSALNNVAKHAKASSVFVSIQKIGQGVELEVSDDGISFKVDQVLNARRFKRLGVLSMRERVEMLEGAFSIESKPGVGTKVHASIPLDKNSG